MTLDWQNNPDGAISSFKKDGFFAFPGFLDESEVPETLVKIERFTAQVVPTLPREQVLSTDVKGV